MSEELSPKRPYVANVAEDAEKRESWYVANVAEDAEKRESWTLLGGM